MSFIISYTSVSYTGTKIPSRFGGSSKYKVIDDELITVEKKDSVEKPKQIRSAKTKSFAPNESFDQETNKYHEVAQIDSEEKEIADNEKKTYRLNKSKLKKKCHAFSRLKKSQQFLAFYSISFPSGLSDELGYQIFNTWLTRCRKNCTLTSYLWVAERQQNGTIHFHLLTNDFMPIKTVNGFMSKALKTYKNRGVEVLKEVETEKYNGVDVKRVGNSRKGLISYLAKYISKNDIKFYRLPWHCSRDVSRLFTSTNFEEETAEEYLNQLTQDLDSYEWYTKPFCTTAAMKFTPPEKIYNDLDGVNEVVYNSTN